MILEIDCGNTRVKWRLLDGDQVYSRGSLTPEQSIIKKISVAPEQIQACRMASVWQEQASLAYAEQITQQGIKLSIAASSAQLAGVTNSYLDPSKLGIDRWLAAVAAYHKYQANCLVLDFGTAVTADYVTAAGCYLGGVIAPGLELMRSTLMQKAQRLNVAIDKQLPNLLSPQLSTATGIEAGVRHMMKGFIEQQLEVAQHSFAGEFELIVVGGDAALLNELGFSAIQEADLVFEGLALACPLGSK